MENTPSRTPGASEAVEVHELPPKLSSLWDRAQQALELKNYDYVMNLLQAVLKEEPRFLSGRKRLREAAIRKRDAQGRRAGLGSTAGISAMKIQPLVKKDPAAALVQIEKDVLAAEPTNPQGNQLLFEAATRMNMPMTAGFALEILVQGNSENTRYKHQLGDFYMEHGFMEEAARVYGSIVAQDPTDLQANQKEKNAAARASMAKQKYEGSVRDNLRDAEQAAQLEAMSRAGMTDEQREERIALLLSKYATNQNDVSTVRALADLYEQKEDFDQALAFYEWSIALSPGDPALEQKVVEVRETQRRRKLTELEQWLAANEGHPEYESVKASFDQFAQTHYQTQIEDYRLQVERNPTDTNLRFKYGEALYQAGLMKEAIPELQRAQQSPSLRIKAMLMLGKCYEKRNMNDLALDQLQRAADELKVMDGTKKEILYTLGLVYEKIGNAAKHLDCMKQIYATDYGYRDVSERVERSYE